MLEPEDFRYALAGIDGADTLFEAVERLSEPTGWVDRLKFGRDLMRLAITHVNDVPVPPPYLPKATYLDWTVRTLDFIKIAFEHMHPPDVLRDIVQRARQT